MMLLGKSIFDLEGREHSMAGILPFKSKKGSVPGHNNSYIIVQK